MTLLSLVRVLAVAALVCAPAVVPAQNLGDPVDVAREFERQDGTYFVASRVRTFDVATRRGTIQWDRYVRQPVLSFNKIDPNFTRAPATEFPGTEYDRDPVLPFAIDFAAPALNTASIDWSHLELRMFGSGVTGGTALVALPNEASRPVRVVGGRVSDDPLRGRVRWTVTSFAVH